MVNLLTRTSFRNRTTNAVLIERINELVEKVNELEDKLETKADKRSKAKPKKD